MSESGMRQIVCRALKPLDAVAVENSVRSGTPDVNFIGGWLELKWLRSWPKEGSSIVKIDHYTQIQKRWAQRRFERGGFSGLLLQVRNEWLLFKPPFSVTYVGKAKRHELVKGSVLHMEKGLDGRLLRNTLRSLTNG